MKGKDSEQKDLLLALVSSEEHCDVQASILGQGLLVARRYAPIKPLEQSSTQMGRQFALIAKDLGQGSAVSRVRALVFAAQTQDNPHVERFFASSLGKLFPEAKIQLMELPELLLRGLYPETGGVALVAGRQLICASSWIPNQGSWQVGDYGPKLELPGSAFWFARQALQAVLAAEDGLMRPTKLRDLFLINGHFKKSDWMERIYQSQSMMRETLDLTAQILNLAEQKDLTAKALRQEAIEMQCRMAVQLTRHFSPDQKIPLCLTGLLYEKIPSYRELVAKAMTQKIRQIEICTETKEPALEGLKYLEQQYLDTKEHES